MAKMERDSMERVLESGSSAVSSAETKTKGGNPEQSWEAKLTDGCADPFTTTIVSLKARNGRGGSQAGV